MSSYSPGQFDGAKNASLPGGARLPFMSDLPLGDYIGELQSMEGGKTRANVDKFKSVYNIIARLTDDGDEKVAYPPTVCRLELATNVDYYLPSIKGEISAVMGGAVPVLDDEGNLTDETRPIEAADIDKETIISAVTEGTFDGQRVLIKVWRQKNKAGDKTYTNSRTYPLPDELGGQYGA